METPLVDRTVPAVLRRGRDLWPEVIALESGSASLTYAELYERSRAVAGGLSGLGTGYGDKVALLQGNSIEHVLSWFGAALLGAVEVPINTALQAEQLAYVLTHSEAEILIAEPAYLPLINELDLAETALRAVVVTGEISATETQGIPLTTFSEVASAAPAKPADILPGDPMGILYTSGTTGPAKGVVVSHAQTYTRMWPGGPGSPRHGDRTLVVLPIFHVIGQCRGLYNTLIVGGTAVLESRFSASRFWETCRRSGITFAPLVGTMVGYLLAQPESSGDRDHSVRHIALGTTSPDVERFRERFGVAEISMSYGLTEAGGVLVADAEPEGCGYLRPDFDARLVDDHDQEVLAGEVGELLLRSHDPWAVLLEYYKMPAETLDRVRNLWLHTGDLMWQRPDGMYMFAGRCGDRIRVRGENVSPAEVEEQLAAFEGIAECVVVGVNSPEQDAAVGDQEILAAYVASDRSLRPAAIAEELSRRLPAFAVPRFWVEVDRLPRTEATQRVQRPVIAERHLRDAWDRRNHPADTVRSAGKQTSNREREYHP